MISRILPQAPFDLSLMLQRTASRPSKMIVIGEDMKSFSRPIRLESGPVLVKVVWSGTADTPLLDIHLPEGLTEQEQTACIQRVQVILSADTDISSFVEKFSGCSVWKPLIQRFHGLRMMLDGCLFESMIKAIIGQQVTVQFAATLLERLLDVGGERILLDGRAVPVFPSAEQIARFSPDDLRRLSFSQRKAEYIIDFARTVVNEEVDLDALQDLPDDEVTARLIQLRGIGRWTVECLLLFGMGRPDVLPAADIGVQKAVQLLYGMDVRPKESELRHLAEHWAPWRSYATYYLWNSLIRLE